MFIIGHLRARGERKVFPIQRADGTNNNEIRQIGQLDTDTRKNGQRGRVFDSQGLAPTIGTMGGGGLEPKIIDMTYSNREPRVTENSPTLRSGRNGIAVACLTPTREQKRQNGRRFKTEGEPSFTLTAQDRQGVAFIQNDSMSKQASKQASKQ